MLDETREIADRSGLVFPSPTGRVLINSTMPRRLREHVIGAMPSGFWSSFQDWPPERADVPRQVCERALARANSNSVEAACRRSDLFEGRRQVIDDWGTALTVGVLPGPKLASC